jgi:hypothetical protein
MSEFVFLQRMYDAGAGECFDVLAVNDYMLWSGPTDRRMRPLNINFSRPAYVRDLMVANHDGAKPIWVSEMNSNAVPNDPTIQGLGAFGQVTLEQQARYAVLAYQRVMEDWPWAGLVNFWFFKRATDSELDQSWYYFRMVEPDFEPMPVYHALAEYATALNPTLYPGAYQEDHWALAYAGREGSGGTGLGDDGPAGWEIAPSHDATYGPTYRRASEAGAELHFTYAGTGVELAPGPGQGLIEVGVDGGQPRQVALNGRPVWVAGGGLRSVLPDLGPGRHSVVVRAIDGEVGVDGLRVARSASLWAWLAAVAVLAAVTSVVLVLVRQRFRSPASS